MTEIFCLLLCLVCVGLAWWSDLDAQKHINKGLEEAWKPKKQGGTHENNH